jgi:phosphatidylglycerophosphate synthase
MSIKKYIPNILSTIRLAMALALPIVFLNTSLLNTLIFYLVGDATDAVDGFLARKWKVQSNMVSLLIL